MELTKFCCFVSEYKKVCTNLSTSFYSYVCIKEQLWYLQSGSASARKGQLPDWCAVLLHWFWFLTRFSQHSWSIWSDSFYLPRTCWFAFISICRIECILSVARPIQDFTGFDNKAFLKTDICMPTLPNDQESFFTIFDCSYRGFPPLFTGCDQQHTAV